MGVIEARRRILLSAPHPVTTTPASVATFNTDMVGKLRSAKFGFLPVQSGTGDPSPTNIRPISGWDGLDVTQCGKNLFNPSTAQSGKYWTNDGIINTTTASLSCSGFIKIKPSTTYCFTGFAGTGFYSGVSFDKNKNVIGNWYAAGSRTEPFVAKTQDNAEWITLNFKTEQLGTMSFYEADSVGSYAPYTGSTYPVSWQSEAGTIYGGYVDVVKGEVVAEYTATSPTISNTTVRTASDLQYPYFMRTEIRDWLNDKNAYFASNMLPRTKTNAEYRAALYGFQFPGSEPVIYWVHPDCATQEGAESLRSNNQIVFAYPLVTPIHYALTPQIIKSLRGANNMWSNANGDTTITYWTH